MSDPLLTQVEVNMWNKRAGRLQYFLLYLLFGGAIGLDHVSKHTAHVLVWYWACMMVIILLISFVCSIKAQRLTIQWLHQDLKRIGDATNELREKPTPTKTTIR